MKISNKIIRNSEFPICKNCIYYKPSPWNEFDSPFNKCEKFGSKDIITGKITYDFAESCRGNVNLCSKEGRFFEKEPRILLKKLKHKIINPLTLIYAIPVVYLIAYYIKCLI